MKSRERVLILSNRLRRRIDDVSDFFLFVFQESFGYDITIKSKKEYKKDKEKYGEHTIITKKKFLRSSRKVYLDKLKYERKLIMEFYREKDSISSVITLRDGIRKIYILAEEIYKFSKKREAFQSDISERRSYLTRKGVIRCLEKIFNVKIKRDYFYFLVGIDRLYFETDIKFSKDFVAEKLSEMWGG